MTSTHGESRRPAGRVLAVVMPVVLILAGAAAFVYAVGWHKIPLLVPQAPAPAPQPPPEFPPDELPFPPPEIAPAAGEPQPAEPEIVYSTENEIIREVTRGGVTRTETGRIARTYTGPPPETCPT